MSAEDGIIYTPYCFQAGAWVEGLQGFAKVVNLVQSKKTVDKGHALNELEDSTMRRCCLSFTFVICTAERLSIRTCQARIGYEGWQD